MRLERAAILVLFFLAPACKDLPSNAEISPISTPGVAPVSTPQAPKSTAVTASPTAIKASSGLVPVVQVVDGDTIKARNNGKVEAIRIIGVDTPEVVDPRKAVQCFGREASAKAKELLRDQKVKLVGDATQTSRDKYDRLLRYVETADGADFGLTMIATGYAHEYTYRVPYLRQAAYVAAEVSARERGLGLWSPLTCNGDTKRPAQMTPANGR